MNVTIKDIAKLSGVGISTVSRVLNGSGPASVQTKQKVMDAVRELNYIPNTNARNLKLGQSKTILVLAKSIKNSYFQSLIGVIEKLVLLRGYGTEIRNVGALEDEMEFTKAEVRNSNYAGVVICGGTFGYKNEDFESIGVPCVLVTIKAADSVDPELYSSVLIDDKAEMRHATEHLIGLGHRRIGCIYCNVGDTVTPNLLRFEGYKEALQRNGIAFDPNLVSVPININASGYEFGFNMMKTLMDKNPDMTAVVAMADVMAIGAAKAALISGWRIPEDISIIGFDGIEAAEYFHPALDTISQPVHQMANSVVDAMSQMIQNGTTSHIVLKSNLIERGSSIRIS